MALTAASQLAGAEMDEARARLAALMGVATEQLSFGPSDRREYLCSGASVR